MPRELVFLLLVIAFVGVFWRHAADRKHVRGLQQEATRAFESLVVKSVDERYQLIGAKATVERREETGGGRGIFESTASLAVTIYAHNEFGESFIFKWHSQSKYQPFVKHLPRQAIS
jgi:hypothetical protein